MLSVFFEVFHFALHSRQYERFVSGAERLKGPKLSSTQKIPQKISSRSITFADSECISSHSFLTTLDCSEWTTSYFSTQLRNMQPVSLLNFPQYLESSESYIGDVQRIWREMQISTSYATAANSSSIQRALCYGCPLSLPCRFQRSKQSKFHERDRLFC
eukprot:c9172_g1_i1.p1 GENE.c9172_g1_i1~~c9172_g1_i1.p1  ORF type:complete len:159 (-),score=18.54 c9172_g1_i1:956-1432(-)